MHVPSNLLYSEAHLWVKKIEGGVLIGITDYAQNNLGELQYIDLPHVGEQLVKGCVYGTAETSKSVSDLFAPVDGIVAEINTALSDAPETINASPYEDGWILRLTDCTAEDFDSLLNAQAYRVLTD